MEHVMPEDQCPVAASVRVRTGDVRGAGTDADVSIILIGSKGQSQEIQLESSADNFERNKVCVVELLECNQTYPACRHIAAVGSVLWHSKCISSVSLWQLDEFKLDLGSQDLGDLQKVDIGFSAKQTVSGIFGGLTGKKWNLTSVEVKIPGFDREVGAVVRFDENREPPLVLRFHNDERCKAWTS
eukprot:scaffold45742_cov18-Tisochrysis_lutea.AAC.1